MPRLLIALTLGLIAQLPSSAYAGRQALMELIDSIAGRVYLTQTVRGRSLAERVIQGEITDLSAYIKFRRDLEAATLSDQEIRDISADIAKLSAGIAEIERQHLLRQARIGQPSSMTVNFTHALREYAPRVGLDLLPGAVRFTPRAQITRTFQVAEETFITRGQVFQVADESTGVLIRRWLQLERAESEVTMRFTRTAIDGPRRSIWFELPEQAGRTLPSDLAVTAIKTPVTAESRGASQQIPAGGRARDAAAYEAIEITSPSLLGDTKIRVPFLAADTSNTGEKVISSYRFKTRLLSPNGEIIDVNGTLMIDRVLQNLSNPSGAPARRSLIRIAPPSFLELNRDNCRLFLEFRVSQQ